MIRARLIDETTGDNYDLIGLVRDCGPELLIGRNFGSHIPTPEDHRKVSRVHARLSYDPSIGFALENNSENGVRVERTNGNGFYLKQGGVLILKDGDRFILDDSDSFLYTEKSA